MLLTAITVQAVALFLLRKWPSYSWGALLDRFVTSPAMAGIFAVFAAAIGAWSLNRQLAHTKQKAHDEAWWEQFEWVTDRIVSPDQEEPEKAAKAKEKLPRSLAYSLMTALSKSANAAFQKAAVDGILSHYLRERPSPEQDGSEISDASHMDATEAESLRGLVAVLPEDSPSRETARRVLSAYEYEDDVRRALRHRLGEAFSEPDAPDFGADAVIDHGSHKLLVEVKQSVTSLHVLARIGQRLRTVMDREEASGGIIVTPPPSLKSLGNPTAQDRIKAMSNERIHLIEWGPAEGSGALWDKIRDILPYVYK